MAHYTATFNANGGTLSGSSSKTVTSTKTYGTLPTATKTEYTFVGWYDAKTGGNKITATLLVNVAADTTFYAYLQSIKTIINDPDNEKEIVDACQNYLIEYENGNKNYYTPNIDLIIEQIDKM